MMLNKEYVQSDQKIVCRTCPLGHTQSGTATEDGYSLEFSI